MSYRIYFDDDLVYSQVATTQGYAIIEADITYELNKAPTLVFSMPPTNPMYDEYVKMKTVVTVDKDGVLLFRGRVLDTTVDFFNIKEFTCEGDFAFFNDSIINPYEYNGTVLNLVTKYVTEHNAQVDEFKRFEIGDVTVMDNNDYVVRSNIEYVYSMDEMNSKLINELGGYLSTETVLDANDEEHHYLNYTADSGGINNQVLSFGHNIVDLEQFVSGEDLCTVVIPLGAKLVVDDTETDERLTVASVNDGSIYIQDDNAVAMFGRIVKVVVWDDVTVASNLLTKGRAWLADNIREATTISLNAIDLSLIDVDVSALKLGEYNRVYSRPHNIDDYFQLSKMVTDLVDPSKSTYTFGYVARSLTDNVTDTVTKQSGATVQEPSNVPIHLFDFTKSNTDSIGNITAILTDATRDSAGLKLTQNSSRAQIDINCKGKTVVIELGDITRGISGMGRLITFRPKNSDAWGQGLYYRDTNVWSLLFNGTWNDSALTNISDLANKTVKFIIKDDGRTNLYVNDSLALSDVDTSGNTYINIGSTVASLWDSTIKSLKIYEGEV